MIAAGLRALPLVGAAGLLAAAPYFASDDFPPSCLSRQHFDTACPACGLTRACARLVEGDVIASIAMHPVAIVLVLEALAFAAFALWSPREKFLPDLARVLPPVLAANFTLITLTWATRFVTDTLPPI